MSLINQMLKDLDARHDADARGRLHREVRPLPVAGSDRGARLAVIALSAISLSAAAWWGYSRFVSEQNAEALLSLPAAAPVAPNPPATPAVAAPVPPSPDEMPGGLKMSAMLDRLPVEKPIEGRPPVDAVLPSRAERVPVAVAPKKPSAAAPAVAVPAPIIEKQPNQALNDRDKREADYRRAVALANGGNAQEATDLLLAVLRQDGGHVGARRLLARLLIELRRFDEAAAILAEGLVAQPGQIAWAMTLARLQVERGDLSAAARTLQASQAYAGDNADYLGFHGHVLHRQGQHKAAAETYQAAARIAPGEGRWWLGLGLALEADARQAEAREAFLRARASGSLNADLGALVDQKLR